MAPQLPITTLEVVKISDNAVNIGHPTFCKVSQVLDYLAHPEGLEPLTNGL